MHLKSLLLSLLPCLLLSSCGPKMGLPDELKISLEKNEQYVKPEDQSYQDLSYADYSEVVTVKNIVDKINNKEDFVFYLHSLECHYCLMAKPIFIKYICSTQYVFSTMERYSTGNSDEDILNELGALYPDTFYKTEEGGLSYGTPYFYFFKEGKLVDASGIPAKGLESYRYFSKFLDSYVKAK